MNRDLHLAAASAAAATAFAVITITAAVEHCQIVHGIHLLSN